jgi:hypothetical protein
MSAGDDDERNKEQMQIRCQKDIFVVAHSTRKHAELSSLTIHEILLYNTAIR